MTNDLQGLKVVRGALVKAGYPTAVIRDNGDGIWLVYARHDDVADDIATKVRGSPGVHDVRVSYATPDFTSTVTVHTRPDPDPFAGLTDE